MATRTTVEQRAQRLFRVVDNAVDKAKLAILQKATRFSGYPERRSYTSTYFDFLPAELQVEVFRHCDYKDLLNLRKTSRAFKNLVDVHEQVIVRKMVVAYEYTLLSELFPPPRNQNGLPRYSIRYIHLLTKRHRTCEDLAYHLAQRAVDAAFASSSRRERRDVAEIAAARIQVSLTRQLYHVYRFLYYTNLHLEAAKASLAIEYENHIEDIDLWDSYWSIQSSLITTLSSSSIISIHHAMTFLVNTIRLSICPDPPYNQNDHMVSLLLRSHKSLKRILEYFQADSRGTPRGLRKNFMTNMQREKEEEMKRSPLLFTRVPRLKETWFEVAQREMESRGLRGHEPELYIFNGFPSVRIGCQLCRDG